MIIVIFLVPSRKLNRMTIFFIILQVYQKFNAIPISAHYIYCNNNCLMLPIQTMMRSAIVQGFFAVLSVICTLVVAQIALILNKLQWNLEQDFFSEPISLCYSKMMIFSFICEGNIEAQSIVFNTKGKNLSSMLTLIIIHCNCLNE